MALEAKQDIEDIFASGDATSRMNSIQNLVEVKLHQGDLAYIFQIVDTLLNEDSPVGLFSRPVLHELAVKIGSLPHEKKKEISIFVLDKLRCRVVSFEEEDGIIREHLAACLTEEGNYGGAARCLAGMNLEGGVRSWSVREKTQKYVLIAELFLKDFDEATAESYCNRAGMLIHEVENDAELMFRYKVTHARILDSKRKFLEAAAKLLELSHAPDVNSGDVMHLLESAATCTILAPAGPQRSRLLASLIREDRISEVRNFEILKKMFLERIISPSEMSALSETLSEAHRSNKSGGDTVAERAIMQHNVLAAARVYKNMKIERLAELLHTTPFKAESIVGNMINERRLSGSIDQKENVIRFGTGTTNIERWDHRIQATCDQVDCCLEDIVRKYPHLKFVKNISV